jgi:hypothetical protein
MRSKAADIMVALRILSIFRQSSQKKMEQKAPNLLFFAPKMEQFTAKTEQITPN